MSELITEKRASIGTSCAITLSCLERYCNAVNAYQKKKNEINASDVWNQNYKEHLVNKEMERLQAAANTEYSEIMRQLDLIEDNARDMEEYLDLGSGELQGALMAVQTVGDKLPAKSRLTIMEKFRGQHQALLLLREAFEKAGMQFTSFDRLIFSVESRIGELEELAGYLITQPGRDLIRVSAFARKIDAFASDMGVTLSTKWNGIDAMSDAFIQELRNAAGIVAE